MNNATLVETLRPLPRMGRVRLATQVDRLRKACDAETALEPFLAEALEVLARIFGATAGAFWFRPWGGGGLCPSVREGFHDLPFSSKGLSQLDSVVSKALHWTEPQIERLVDLGAIVLVAPIRDGQQAIGAVQLVIVDPADHESLEDQQQREAVVLSYRRALSAVLSMVQPALLRRMQVNAVPLAQAEESLRGLTQQIAGMQRSIRLAIERYLQQLSGATFGSLESNQKFTKQVQALLDAHGLRVRCPECGHPAILRCSRNASSAEGVFVFDHYLPDGRTFHGGGRSLPVLRTIAKPSRRQSSS